MHRSRPLLGLILLGTLLATALGCREEVPPLFTRNRPPDTALTIVPEDSSEAFYRYHVYWRGEDPDGEVVRYLFAITDTLARDPEDRWDPELASDIERGVFTTRTDSVFFFNSQAGRQAFNIVAIDDFGEKDPSPARSFFRVTDNGLPRVVYLDVIPETNDPRVAPCIAADSCTLSTFTDFRIRFTATTSNGGITGYTWQTDPSRWEPFGGQADTNFVELSTIDGDTVVFDFDGRPAWELSESQDEVTVYLRSNRDEPVIGDRFSGNFLMKARTRDDARLQSITRRGERRVTVNYDPDTRMFRVPECDCPNPPPSCDPQKLVPAGWVTGIGEVDSFGTVDDWVLFCEGDTISNFSFVRFYANGWDDSRDLPIDPDAPSLPEVDYRFRFEYSARDFSSSNMPLSQPPQRASDLVLPVGQGGGTFRGAFARWKTCAFDYVFQASAVDEHDRVDGTAAQVKFFVGGAPVIDSLQVPSVLVFIPECSGFFAPAICADFDSITFGPDTLAVRGDPEADAINPLEWQTPWGLGWNTFTLPFKAFGHDHPRDQNTGVGPNYYKSEDEGHIRSWRFSFDCVEPACEDLQLRGEDVWGENVIPPGQGPIDVFDDVLTVVRVPLDTLCIAADSCDAQSSRARLVFQRFGTYLFEIQGRDSEFIGQTCSQPSDLGPDASQFSVGVSNLGRVTQVARKTVKWVQLSDVRPNPPISSAATTTRSRPFVNRKRLMQ